jgi:type I restriction enzyme S subunit
MNNELPQGWIRVPLSTATAFVPTGVPPFKGEVEYYSTGSIQAGAALPEGRFTFHSRPSRANRWSCQGDVMQARMQGTDKGILIGNDLADRLFSTGFLQLRADSHLCEPRFVALYVRSPEFLSTRDELATGSTQVALTDAGAGELTIPLAPLPEQRRIVAKLEKLLGKVDACQQRLAKIPILLKRFRQSVLAAACSGRLTADRREENEIEVDASDSAEVPDGFPSLPETWRWQLLDSVCEKIVDCPHSTPKWAESGRLCVRTTNFKPGFLDLSEVRYVSNETFAERIERLRPRPRDILYSREGGILGIACMIPPKVELCLGQRMMLFRTKSDFSATFLMHWLNSRVILRRVQELTGGSASPHLNVRDIKSFPTPIPPTPEQQEIVRRVEALFTLADQLEARYAKAAAHVEKLTQSILAKAFRGELVPQDPNDKPASVLLERIRNAKRGAARKQSAQLRRSAANQAA